VILFPEERIMRSSILAVLVILALPALTEEKANDTSLKSEAISSPGAAEIISVIANMNASANQTIQDIDGWTYILKDENGKCTVNSEPTIEGSITANAMACPEDLAAIDEEDINITRAADTIENTLPKETAFERIFLTKPVNSTEPIWCFITPDGKTILIGARSGDILSGVRTKSRAASRGAISDTFSDLIDTVSDAEYYICVDACIAACHSLPSDAYSPGYTLDNCISDCPDDCKK
jgi:hypothetical protein